MFMSLAKYLSLGEKIKYLREKNNITQKEMAAKLEIATSTYYNYENNNREPNMRTLERIADIFGVSLVDILNINPSSPEDLDEMRSNNLYYSLVELTTLNSEEEILETLEKVRKHRSEGLLTKSESFDIKDQIEFIIEKILLSDKHIELSSILAIKTAFNLTPSLQEKYIEYSPIELVDIFSNRLWLIENEECREEGETLILEILKCLGLEYVLQIIENEDAYIDSYISLTSVIDEVEYTLLNTYAQRRY